MSTARRSAFLAGSQVAAELVGSVAVAQAWEKPSVLPTFTVAELAGHLARQAYQTLGMLQDADAASTLALITAEQYYGDLMETNDPESELNQGVRARARAVSEKGREATVLTARENVTALSRRLPGEPIDRRINVWGRSMLVDEYLRTRHVEIACHVEDLALSVDVPTPALPELIIQDAVDVLVGAARHRHGDVAVLRALARRERDTIDAIRAL